MKTIKTYLLLILALVSPNQKAIAAQPSDTIYMITIHTDNFEKMRLFYEQTMQFRIISESGEFIEFASQGIRLSLVSYNALSFLASESLKQKKVGSGLGIGFKFASKQQVDDRYHTLINKGAVPINAPTAQDWGEYTAFFADPDGNIHELVSDIKKPQHNVTNENKSRKISAK